MSLPAPACHLGYPPDQIEQILRAPELRKRFWRYMRGQTMAICNQEPEREWVEDPASPGGMRLVDIAPPRCDRPHGGPLTYPWDLERFLLGAPPID